MVINVLQLPDEVLLDIAEELSQRDWTTLCRASKRLRRIVEPLLYRSINLRWDETSYHPPIARLLRSILENPELSLHVRALELVGRYYRRVYVPSPTSLPLTADLPHDKLVAAASSMGAPPDMPNEILLGNPDAFIAFFVGKLENLEYLFLDVNWTLDTRLLGSLLKDTLGKSVDGPVALENDPAPRKSPFEALRKVFLITNEHEGSEEKPWPRDTRDGLNLFYLPNIEHLTIAVANPIDFSWPFQHAPNPSHLSTLELYRVRECYLGTVLSGLGSLQKLRYIWTYQPDIDGDVSKEVVQLELMAAAILQARDTLTDLEIIARPRAAIAWGDLIDPEIRMQGSLSALSQLHKLKRLVIPWTFLAGLDEAPPPGAIGSVLSACVEQLEIHLGPGSLDDDFFSGWDNKDYRSCFDKELRSGAMAHCTSLRHVELPGYITSEGPPLEETLALKNLSDEFGISVGQGGYYPGAKPHKLGDNL